MIRWAGMEILEQFAEVVEPKHGACCYGMFQRERLTAASTVRPY